MEGMNYRQFIHSRFRFWALLAENLGLSRISDGAQQWDGGILAFKTSIVCLSYDLAGRSQTRDKISPWSTKRFPKLVLSPPEINREEKMKINRERAYKIGSQKPATVGYNIVIMKRRHNNYLREVRREGDKMGGERERERSIKEAQQEEQISFGCGGQQAASTRASFDWEAAQKASATSTSDESFFWLRVFFTLWSSPLFMAKNFFLINDRLTAILCS